MLSFAIVVLCALQVLSFRIKQKAYVNNGAALRTAELTQSQGLPAGDIVINENLTLIKNANQPAWGGQMSQGGFYHDSNGKQYVAKTPVPSNELAANDAVNVKRSSSSLCQFVARMVHKNAQEGWAAWEAITGGGGLNFLDGGSGSTKEKRQRKQTQAAMWLNSFAKGLNCLHSIGYVHGDLSTGNVRYVESGEASIIDLGTATTTLNKKRDYDDFILLADRVVGRVCIEQSELANRKTKCDQSAICKKAFVTPCSPDAEKPLWNFQGITGGDGDTWCK